MGAEASCTLRFKGRTSAGRARLETDVLEFRGGDVSLVSFSATHTAEKFVIPVSKRGNDGRR